MNIRFEQVPVGSRCFSEKYHGKWYASIEVPISTLKSPLHRYLSPGGWSRTAHYFDTRDQAEQAAGLAGTQFPPVTPQEIQFAMLAEEDMRQCMEEDFFNEIS